MNNTVGNILNFFADTSKSLGARIGTIVISITLLFFVDIISGITYNFQVNNKLSQLEKIDNLKRTYSNAPKKLESINKTEEQILNKMHYSEVVSSWFVSAAQLTAENISQPNNANATNSILDRNLMILSSSYSLIILIPMFIIAPFFSNSKQRFDKNLISGLIAGIILLITTIAVTTALSYLIPIIDEEKPYWNYLINIAIHTFFIILFVRTFKK